MNLPSQIPAALLLFILTLPHSIQAQPTQPAAPASDQISLDFEMVDIAQLVEILSDRTGKLIVMDEAVHGKVSLVAPDRVSVERFHSLVVSILQSRGFSVVDQNGSLFVNPRDKAATVVPPGTLVGPTNAIPTAGTVTKVFKLENIEAGELQQMFELMIPGGKQGAVSVAPGNYLILTDTASNMRAHEGMIKQVDSPSTFSNIQVIKLQHASAENLARELSEAIAASESAGSKYARSIAGRTGGVNKPAGATVIPIASANSLIVIGSMAQIDQVKKIVEQIDIEDAAGRGRLQAIFLNFLRAEDAATELNNLLQKTAAKGGPPQIAIEADVANNALLVDADPVDFKYLQNLLQDLDRKPKQVMVEVLIAEVSSTDGLDLGVEFATTEQPRDGSTTVIGRNRPGETDDIADLATSGNFMQGFSFGLAEGVATLADGSSIPLIPVLIRALSQKRDVEILSNIPLWAQNNVESTVSVVENIPVLRSTIEGGSGTARDVIQNIDRIDVGITFSVTPLVTPDNEVTLKLKPTIEAIIDPGPADTPFTPTIAKREVETTVTIPDGATVIISGLKRIDNIKQNYRMPILGDIPLLGHLFRRTSNTKQRTNVIIFVTPHVVDTTAREDELQKEWEKKTGLDERFDPESVPIWPQK